MPPVVPYRKLQHKFFETDLPFGLCTFVDIARMIGVETPLIEAMILWNQKVRHEGATATVDAALNTLVWRPWAPLLRQGFF